MKISGYPVEAQVDGSDLLEEIPIRVGVPSGVLQISGPPRSLPQIPSPASVWPSPSKSGLPPQNSVRKFTSPLFNQDFSRQYYHDGYKKLLT